MGRAYDHRIKEMIAKSGDPHLFPELNIPMSTAKHWIRCGIKTVVELPSENDDIDFKIKVASLEKQLAAVNATHRLVVFTFKLFGLQIQYTRLPGADAKAMLIAAIQGATKLVPLVACLEAIGLSAARFRAWCRRERHCKLADQPSCPRLSPSRLTVAEVEKIRELVTSPRFAHYSMTALAMYAKRHAEVFASSATWGRVVRKLGLKRAQRRVHPPKPRLGIRATGPFQIWHLDLTVVRLLDGTRAFVQAVIDNYSRYVLAVRTTTTYGGTPTKELLLTALAKARTFGYDNLPTVIVDSGSENLNAHVDGLVDGGSIHRLVAQIDIEFSNSMVEALFRRMKHGYLFLQRLADATTLAGHVEYFLREHNDVIPHPALHGATPLEIVTGRWTNASRQALKSDHDDARATRLVANRALACASCSILTPS